MIVGIARACLLPATVVACALRRALFPVRLTRRVDDEVRFETPVWRTVNRPRRADDADAGVGGLVETNQRQRDGGVEAEGAAFGLKRGCGTIAARAAAGARPWKCRSRGWSVAAPARSSMANTAPDNRAARAGSPVATASPASAASAPATPRE